MSPDVSAVHGMIKAELPPNIKLSPVVSTDFSFIMTEKTKGLCFSDGFILMFASTNPR